METTRPTDQDFQQELYQLFEQAGEKQFMIKMYRKTIDDANNELNALNEKIKRKQVEYRNFIDRKGKQAPQPTPVEATPASQEPQPEPTSAETSNQNS